MTYKERVKREEGNRDRMFVYDEGGLFHNLYERSAYAFCRTIKECKVNIRSISYLEEPLAYIGVPTTRIANYLPMERAERIDGKCYAIPLSEPIDEDDFARWKSQAVKEHEERERRKVVKDDERKAVNGETSDNANEADNIVIRHCVTRIRNLNMASMTPMEAMNFLHEMQEKLREINC